MLVQHVKKIVGVKSQGPQNILTKLILKMMYQMKKKNKTIKKRK
jgi:hypothetical protein